MSPMTIIQRLRAAKVVHYHLARGCAGRDQAARIRDQHIHALDISVQTIQYTGGSHQGGLGQRRQVRHTHRQLVLGNVSARLVDGVLGRAQSEAHSVGCDGVAGVADAAAVGKLAVVLTPLFG